jgi:tetratricopeptide (TPR) repeat protein
VPVWRLLFLLLAGTPILLQAASSNTILVIPFNNDGQAADLSWIGESVAETLTSEMGAAGQIVLDREARMEGDRRLGLKPDSLYTKATLLKLGQTLDADLVCYGAYQMLPSTPDTPPRDSSLRISARFLDLRKLRDATEFSETGKLSDLSRLEEHLSWQAIRFLDPQTRITAEQLLKPAKLIRVDAKESYIRGLLATSSDQKQKWFEQAVKLDSKYTQPQFELGMLAMRRRDYRQAAALFAKIVNKDDPLYLEARFRMGFSAYASADFVTARSCFRELAQTAPLNEVFNNLGAAESRLNDQTAVDDFRRALDGDPADATYNFNLALALYRTAKFDDAAKHLRTVLDHKPGDNDATALLARCQERTALTSANARNLPGERLKQNFDITAFRQLKAMLQTSR